MKHDRFGVANWFIRRAIDNETIKVFGNVTLDNVLFTDSYIRFNYTSTIEPFGYGEISFDIESPRLNESTGPALITDSSTGTKEGWYFVLANTEVIDARITSYSSRYWTDRLYVKNDDINWTRIFWLNKCRRNERR